MILKLHNQRISPITTRIGIQILVLTLQENRTFATKKFVARRRNFVAKPCCDEILVARICRKKGRRKIFFARTSSQNVATSYGFVVRFGRSQQTFCDEFRRNFCNHFVENFASNWSQLFVTNSPQHFATSWTQMLR